MMSSLPLKQKRQEKASGGASSATLLLHPHRDWPSRDGLYSLTQYLSHIPALIYPSIQRQHLSLLFWSIIHPQSLIYGSISRPCYTTFKTTILQQSVLVSGPVLTGNGAPAPATVFCSLYISRCWWFNWRKLNCTTELNYTVWPIVAA